VCAAYAAYALAFVWQSAVVVHGERVAVLFDDAMISMRYARNLVEGHGLVWNPGGERLEGYTNFLWVLAMSAAHLLPLGATKVAFVVQGLGGVLALTGVLLAYRLARELTGRGWVAVAAACLTAGSFPLTFWSLNGMEVALVAPLVTLAALWAVRSLRRDVFDPWPIVLLGLGQAIRPDLLVPAVALGLYLILFDGPRRRRWAVATVLACGVPLALLTAFRLAYFGELLPNTYYLKVVGFPLGLRVAQGGARLARFALAHGIVPVVAPLGYVLLARRRDLGLLAVLFLAQAAYSVSVGGDAWEDGAPNRYLVVAWPLLLVLLAVTGAAALDGLRVALPSASVRSGLAALAVTLTVVGFAAYRGAQSLDWWTLRERHPDVAINRDSLLRARLVQEIGTPDATVAVVLAGALPYFAERPSIDLLGKCDRIVAHGPGRVRPEKPLAQRFRPGHAKWDYDESIRRRAPDVVAQLYGSLDEGLAALGDDYVRVGPTADGIAVFVRKGSARVRWDAVARVVAVGRGSQGR